MCWRTRTRTLSGRRPGAGRTAPRAARSPRSLSSSCSAASASSRCSSFVAPTIGAVTAGLWKSHASATCARRDAALGRDLPEPVDDRLVELGLRVERVAERVGLGAQRQRLVVPAAVPGQSAACERAPRHDRDSLVDALRDHLPLLLAVHQVVVVLHRDEPCPAVPCRDRLGLRELPRVHAARADVARLAGADDVVERLHRLLDRRRVVEAVDLVEVDVVEPEALQRRVDRGEDVLAPEAAPVRAGHRRAVDLRRDNVLPRATARRGGGGP